MTGELRGIPEVRPAEEGQKPASQISVQQAIQTLAENIHKLEGRLGGIAMRDSVTIDGDLDVDGEIEGDDLSLSDSLKITERAVNVGGGTAPSVSGEGEGVIYFDRALDKFQVSEDGGAFEDLVKDGFTLTANVGVWRKTAASAGVGSYDWDTEVVNTGAYVRQASNTQIKVATAGRYMIHAHLGNSLDAGAATDCRMFHNTSEVSRGYIQTDTTAGYGEAHCDIALTMAADDYVEFKNVAGTRYGHATQQYTHLTIYRLGD